MANPNKAIHKLFIVEGFKSDHPSDVGGETTYGIAKNFWPDYYEEWGGPPSEKQARQFYKDEFWGPLSLDDIIDDRMAYEILEQAVHMGKTRAVKFAQLCYNWTTGTTVRLKVDGIIGPKTAKYLNTMWASNTHRWIKAMNGVQFCYYLFRVDYLDRLIDVFKTVADETQRIFFRGWLMRVEFPGEGP